MDKCILWKKTYVESIDSRYADTVAVLKEMEMMLMMFAMMFIHVVNIV